MPFSRGALHNSFLTGFSRRAFVVSGMTVGAASAAVLGSVACGSSESRSPFVLVRDGGADAAPSSEAEGGATAPVDAVRPEAGTPGEWGGPCLDDGQCS